MCFRAKRLSSFIFIFFFCLSSIFAETSTDSYILNLPVERNLAVPPWLEIASATDDSFAQQEFKILPPLDSSDLAVTFSFVETEEGFLRVFWKSANHSQMLADNLFEGVGTTNRRTLLIKHELLTEPGSLQIQSSSNQLGVYRIEWNWTKPAIVDQATNITAPVLALGAGQIFNENEVNGLPPAPVNDAVSGKVVTTFLTEKPERLENGLEVVFPLMEVPQWARLEAKFLAVDLQQKVQVWINNRKVGNFSLTIPDAQDNGYETAIGEETPQYSGWRTGTLFVAAGFLQKGENVFNFTTMPNDSSGRPCAVKQIEFQLNYAKPKIEIPALAKMEDQFDPNTQSQPTIETAPLVTP